MANLALSPLWRPRTNLQMRSALCWLHSTLARSRQAIGSPDRNPSPRGICLPHYRGIVAMGVVSPVHVPTMSA